MSHFGFCLLLQGLEFQTCQFQTSECVKTNYGHYKFHKLSLKEQLIYLSYFQKFCNSVHPDEKLFIQVECIPCLFLSHIKIFLEEVDDAIIVAGKQADQISKEKHEAGVDDPIVKILEIEDSNPRDMRICSSFTHS